MIHHIETYAGATLVNVSAHSTKEAAEEYLRRYQANLVKTAEGLLRRSLLDLDADDRDPLAIIAAMEELESGYVRHIVPCEYGHNCAACYEAGFIELTNAGGIYP